MKRHYWFFLIGTIYLVGFLSHALYLKKTVYGDGIYYYAWLRSVVIDRDINFTNDYAALGANQQLTTKGLLGNIYSVGPALLWSPQFLWIHRLVNADGLTFPYQLTVGLTGVFYALFGLLLLYRTLTRFFPKTTAVLTVTAIAFTTNLFFYGSLDTVNSHSLSFFAASLFLAFLTQPNTQPLLLGASVGLLALIRPQDALFGILLLPRVNRKTIIPIATGTILAFLPQLLAWQTLYGKFWVSPYLDRGYGFNFFQPHLVEVLFSPRNGLIFWTPVVAVALAGFALREFPKTINRWLVGLLIALQLYLVASWTTWWQGASYSGRMFISLLPLASLGLAAVFKRLQAKHMKPSDIALSVILPLSAINALFIIYFLLTK